MSVIMFVMRYNQYQSSINCKNSGVGAPTSQQVDVNGMNFATLYKNIAQATPLIQVSSYSSYFIHAFPLLVRAVLYALSSPVRPFLDSLFYRDTCPSSPVLQAHLQGTPPLPSGTMPALPEMNELLLSG